MHIGSLIRGVLLRQGRSAAWLAARIPCERSNVYHIFKRDDIGVVLLLKISKILEHDFLQDIDDYYHSHPEEVKIEE